MLRHYYEVTKMNVEDHIDHIVKWIKTYFVENGPNSKAVIGISGGKDSTIAAALCVRALGAHRVIGVLMPDTVQKDIEDSHRVVKALHIPFIEVNIGPAVSKLYECIDRAYDYKKDISENPIVYSNTPARIRMTTLYAISADVGGRVCNTCNLSEDYVGYSTKFGDAAGDFSPLSQYTVRDLMIIGDALDEIPNDLIHKKPADGMCGKTDEDNLGFTYDTLDNFILNDIIPSYDEYQKITELHKRNQHKLQRMPVCRRYDGREDSLCW